VTTIPVAKDTRGMTCVAPCEAKYEVRQMNRHRRHVFSLGHLVCLLPLLLIFLIVALGVRLNPLVVPVVMILCCLAMFDLMAGACGPGHHQAARPPVHKVEPAPASPPVEVEVVFRVRGEPPNKRRPPPFARRTAATVSRGVQGSPEAPGGHGPDRAAARRPGPRTAADPCPRRGRAPGGRGAIPLAQPGVARADLSRHDCGGHPPRRGRPLAGTGAVRRRAAVLGFAPAHPRRARTGGTTSPPDPIASA
jgi:hypothetical protein